VIGMRATYQRKAGVAMRTLSHFASDERGATSLEYGLIAGFVSVAILSAVVSMGDSIGSIFGSLSTDLDAAASRMPN
jgi:pilus assembly protein Flp/PilA